jgi:hypothetical protein
MHLSRRNNKNPLFNIICAPKPKINGGRLFVSTKKIIKKLKNQKNKIKNGTLLSYQVQSR